MIDRTFDPEEAVFFGINEAIIIDFIRKDLWYRAEIQLIDEIEYREFTKETFVAFLPFWDWNKISRLLSKLERLEVISVIKSKSIKKSETLFIGFKK